MKTILLSTVISMLAMSAFAQTQTRSQAAEKAKTAQPAPQFPAKADPKDLKPHQTPSTSVQPKAVNTQSNAKTAPEVAPATSNPSPAATQTSKPLTKSSMRVGQPVKAKRISNAAARPVEAPAEMKRSNTQQEK